MIHHHGETICGAVTLFVLQSAGAVMTASRSTLR
jgi:hypothetical protein